eukprot:1291110-Alexandrium_andersonii.AAC.1
MLGLLWLAGYENGRRRRSGDRRLYLPRRHHVQPRPDVRGSGCRAAMVVLVDVDMPHIGARL